MLNAGVSGKAFISAKGIIEIGLQGFQNATKRNLGIMSLRNNRVDCTQLFSPAIVS